ncbi:retrovirus-related Pol polyprotein from transposon opus [Elysia marginata]|uniref:Retrovirus-related Pol polyprotein from transposon opus n=1 Tax=Elysia marginata TaxID=1093978 RepID=A0AAV4JFD5_9GAST|nr:retrovirus-related Pol polyprotein from transposon opus [Elysia marginata]
MRYQSPFVASENNYICQVGASLRTYHANLMKKYEERTPLPPHDILLPHAAVAFIKEDDPDMDTNIEFPQIERKEFPANVTINEKLTPDQQSEARQVVEQFSHTLSNVPGRTSRIKHYIRLTDDKPFQMRQYPIPVHATDVVDKEIDNMLVMGIIRRSSSPYASPIMVVMKKDKTIRLCIDFRRLNSLTIFDAEPIPTLEELLAKMKGAHFFFKM